VRVAFGTEVWVPLVPYSPRAYLTNRRGQFTQSIARLKPGVTLARARSGMTSLFRELRQAESRDYPDTRSRNGVDTSSLDVVPVATGLDSGLRWRFATPLWVAMGVVAEVLLIACANVANLLLARAAWRRKEFSVRLALGCGRGRLVRQLLTESVLLASIGTLAGLGLAYWGTRTLVVMADAGPLDLQPDLAVLAFVTVMTLLTGIGFGIAPALRAGRTDPSPGLSGQGRGGIDPSVRRRLSRTLVLAQVALSLALLIGAGLMIRTIHNLGQVDLGFKPEQVLMFNIAHIPRDGTPAALARVARDVHQRVRQISGVQSASLSTIPLFSDTDLYAPLNLRDPAVPPDARVDARFNSVSPGYLETTGMVLLEGRSIEESDSGERLVAVVNESFVRKYFPRGNVIGQTMELAVQAMAGKPIEIVGVVRDAKYNDVRAATKPMFFRSIQQFPGRIRAIEVRTAAPAPVIVAAVRQALLEAGPDLMVLRVAPLTGQIERTLAAERLMSRLCATFGVIALLLAAVGLYGVLSYAVAQRTAEIGIRMALGATGRHVRALIVRQSLLVVAGGVIVGLTLALVGTRFITAFLYGLTPTDAGTIFAATAVLTGAAAVAAYLPARRASRVEPVVALRQI
jgi:predicted permease